MQDKNQSSINEETVTGRLENWTVREGKGFYVLYGNVYEDSKRRFRDGYYIHTSYIEGKSGTLKEGDKVTTLNSTYLLGKPYDLGQVHIHTGVKDD